VIQSFKFGKGDKLTMIQQEKVRKNRKPLITKSFFEYQRFPLWKDDKKITSVAIASIILLISAWIFIAKFFNELPPEIPLYFVKIGNGALAEKKDLYFLPLGFAFFTFLNLYLAHYLYRKEKLLSNILIYICLFLNIMLILIIFKLSYITGLIF